MRYRNNKHGILFSEQKEALLKQQKAEKEALKKFREKVEEKLNKFLQDPSQTKHEFEPMNKVYRSVV